MRSVRVPGVESFRSNQKGVVLGVLGAIFLTIGGFYLPSVWQDFPLAPTDPMERLSLWMTTSLVLAAWVVLAIFALASFRFFSSVDIDAAVSPNVSSGAHILRAYLQNTLEQALLAFIAYGAWFFLAAPGWRALPLIFVAFFSIGRVLFIIFYRYGARGRALGFGMTFYPTAGMIALLLPIAIFDYFTY